jgi:hypothetical protein
MACRRIVKWFRDYADDIEAVNIHFTLTPSGQSPDWERSRVTRYMPLVTRLFRMKELRLPQSIPDSSGNLIREYSLHYYFEIWRAGDRHYSPLYSEEVVNEAVNGAGREENRRRTVERE